MPISADIYSQVQQPQQHNPLASLAQAYQIKGLQAGLDREDRAQEQQNRLLSLVQDPSFNQLSAKDQAAKLRGGAFFDQAGKVITDDAKASKDTREGEKFQLEGAMKKMEAMGQIMAGVKDQATYDIARQQASQIFGAEAMAGIPPVYNPQEVAQRQQQAMSVKDGLDQRYKMLSLGETQRHNMTTEGLTGQAQALTAQGQEIQKRGQDMTDTRAREFNATKVEENKLKREQKQETADLTKAGQVASFDTMLGTLDRLSNHAGLKNSVGLRGKLPTIPGSDSANFQAELDTFQSQAFIPMVAQLKGMGALSDAEGKRLTQAVGALNPNMGEKAFRESIDRITTSMNEARSRVAGAPKSTGGATGDFGEPVKTKVVGGKTYAHDGKGWYPVN